MGCAGFLVAPVGVDDRAGILQEGLEIEALTCREDQLPRHITLRHLKAGPGGSHDLVKRLIQKLLCSRHPPKATSLLIPHHLSIGAVEKRRQTTPYVDVVKERYGRAAPWVQPFKEAGLFD